MPDRHGPMRTVLGRYMNEANNGVIEAGGIAVGAGEVGLMPEDATWFGSSAEIDPETTALIVPSSVRVAGEIPRSGTMAHIHGAGIGATSVDMPRMGYRMNAYADLVEEPFGTVERSPFYPHGSWVPGVGEDETSVVNFPLMPGRFMADRHGPMRDDGEVVVMLGEADPEDVFGVSAEEMPGERIERGATVETENTVFVGPGELFVEIDDVEIEELFDSGVMTPLGGAGFGMAMLTTPSAEVAGQDANPVIALDTEDLLTREETQQLIGEASAAETDSVEWIEGPSQTDFIEGPSQTDFIEGPSQTDFTIDELLLGTEPDLEMFTGIISGEEAPWGITIGVVRGTPDDHVIVAGVSTRPVGSEDGMEAIEEDENVIANLSFMLLESVSRLESE